MNNMIMKNGTISEHKSLLSIDCHNSTKDIEIISVDIGWNYFCYWGTSTHSIGHIFNFTKELNQIILLNGDRKRIRACFTCYVRDYVLRDKQRLCKYRIQYIFYLAWIILILIWSSFQKLRKNSKYKIVCLV